MLGVKPPPPELHAPALAFGRGSDSNGVMIGCDVGQLHPGQGKLRLTGYVVYVPTNYTGSEKLPWLLALSPSGSAADWDELLADSCNKHHWAYAASQNSKDSIAWLDVEPHLRDTVEGALKRFPLDPNGLCVVEFFRWWDAGASDCGALAECSESHC